MSEPITPTADIRRRMSAGEPLRSYEVATDYGVSRSLLGVIIQSLREEGATILKEREGIAFRFTLTHPTPDPALQSTWGKGANVSGPTQGPRAAGAPPREPRAKKERTDELRAKERERKRRLRESKRVAAHGTNGVVRAALNGHANGTDHPVPQLGESVQVFLLALNDDGRVSVGLRDSERTWLTTVDGFSNR